MNFASALAIQCFIALQHTSLSIKTPNCLADNDAMHYASSIRYWKIQEILCYSVHTDIMQMIALYYQKTFSELKEKKKSTLISKKHCAVISKCIVQTT